MLEMLASAGLVTAAAAVWGAYNAVQREQSSPNHAFTADTVSKRGAGTVSELDKSDAIDGGHDSKADRIRTDGGRPNDGEIKLVMAVVRPDKLAAVKQALAEAGAPSLTVTNVSGRGSQPAKTGQWRGEEYMVDLHQKVKVECVVAEIPTADVVNAIQEGARTGEPGDGKVFVLPVNDAHQIRTGDAGFDAV